MKKTLFTLFMVLLISAIKAQQANVQIVLNYSPGTCKVQVEYWIKNPTNGNGSIQVAVSNAAFQWDSTLFTLVKDSSCATGLNQADIFPGKDDIDSFSTRTVNGSSFRALDMKRSTKYCDNVYQINPGETKPLGIIVLQFRNCSDANAYNFIDTTATNYIADINDGVNNPSASRKILAIVNKTTRPMDKSGTNCNPGTIISNLNNIPVGDTASAQFVAQGPLLVNRLKSFNAVKLNNHAKLIWETFADVDIKEFEVQRKVSNRFETIGYVASALQIVYSKETVEYTFIDADNPKAGVIYYRIHQISFDGKECYSEIKAIRNSKMLQVLIYPNPSNGKINIVLPDGNGATDITMIDFSGKLIKTWTGYKILNIQLTDLNRGIYTLLISNRETGEKVSQKIIVQ